MTTVHAYTNDQRMQDMPHSDLYQAVLVLRTLFQLRLVLLKRLAWHSGTQRQTH